MDLWLSGPKGVRFGLFEADFVAGELRKHGRKLKLQEQPFQVLALLVQHAGQVVPREELQKALWPADTFVEFDQAVNTAIKKIRQALGDSAENRVSLKRCRAKAIVSLRRSPALRRRLPFRF